MDSQRWRQIEEERMPAGIRPRAPHPFQGFAWSTVTRTADMFPAR